MLCRRNKPFVNQVNVFSFSLLFSKLIQSKSMKLPNKLRLTKQTMINKAIRDGRPRPPRHQGFIAISYGGSELRHRSILETITHRPKCQIQSCRYYIPLHFDTNPESLRPFVPEIWPNNVFNLSATYDLDL